MAILLRLVRPFQGLKCVRAVLDDKFRAAPAPYIAQCGVATVAMFLILSLLDAVTQTVLIASLGASAFIAFTMPHIVAASPRYLIGGYIVGGACGILVSLVATLLPESGPLAAIPNLRPALGALAAGLAMFAMVVTDTEHPPAAALALGFVFNEWDAAAIVVVLGGITALTAVKELCKPVMRDLL